MPVYLRFCKSGGGDLNCHGLCDVRNCDEPIERRPQQVAVKLLVGALSTLEVAAEMHTACTRIVQRTGHENREKAATRSPTGRRAKGWATARAFA
jgi:hypothetical protein